MAKQVIVTLVDDIDGSEAQETVAFAYRGVSYSIDLSEKHAAAFDKAMSRFVASATRESGRRKPSAGGGAPGGKRADLSDVRAWANQNGYAVSPRGRVAAEVVAAYDAAH